jgi:hypothetical protein
MLLIKKIILFFLFLLAFCSVDFGQQLYQGIYTEQTLLTDSKSGTSDLCYDYDINFFPNCTLPAGMRLYLRIDSISGANDSVELYNYPDHVYDVFHINDTIYIGSLTECLFYFFSNSTLYISLVEIGTPQVLGENYYCNYTKYVGPIFDDNCINIFTQFAGGNGGMDTIKNCSVMTANVCIQEQFNNEQILLYPNPATEDLKIKSPPLSTIEITDINGQLIETLFCNTGTTSVDLKGLSCGVYIVRVKSDKEIVTKRIIKE